MARYIDADKLWNDRPIIPRGKNKSFQDGFYECLSGISARIIDQIDYHPADVVEVVRCCDCKHSTINGGDCNSIIVHYVRNEITQLNEAAYSRLDYCSYGERKEQT